MLRRVALIGSVLVASALPSGCSRPASEVGPYPVAIGTNARTEQLDAFGFAIVLDGDENARVVGTLLNTEHRPHAVTGAAIKSDGTPVRAALLTDVIRLPPRTPVHLLEEPLVSVPAGDLAVGSFVELTLDVTDGELVEMLVPVEAARGPYADVDVDG